MFKNLIHQKEGAVSIIQLNRPQKKNSLNEELRKEMETALKEIAGDSRQRVVIVTGGEELYIARLPPGWCPCTSTCFGKTTSCTE